MGDLIDRQNAIDVLEILADKMSDAGKTVMAQAVAVLKDLQSAEPERKKGKGIYDTERVMNNGGIYRKYHCSECGQQIIGAVRNFCPYCGAEMNRGDR